MIPAGDIKEFYVFTAVELDRIISRGVTPPLLALMPLCRSGEVELKPDLVIGGVQLVFAANAKWWKGCLMEKNHFRNRAEKIYFCSH